MKKIQKHKEKERKQILRVTIVIHSTICVGEQ